MTDPCHERHSAWRLQEFCSSHPNLRVTFLPRCGLRIEGELAFRAAKDGFAEIDDTFSVRIEIPSDFPSKLPNAFETAGRIPLEYHKFTDESLCLGSPLRQRLLIAKNPTLPGFVELLLIPYLFNRSYFEKHNRFPIGELAHGAPGLVADYEKIFKVEGAMACTEMLSLLGLPKRTANKRPCPCGSGRRLGKCHNTVLNPLRRMATRREFQEQLRLLRGQFEQEGSDLPPTQDGSFFKPRTVSRASGRNNGWNRGESASRQNDRPSLANPPEAVSVGSVLKPLGSRAERLDEFLDRER